MRFRRTSRASRAATARSGCSARLATNSCTEIFPQHNRRGKSAGHDFGAVGRVSMSSSAKYTRPKYAIVARNALAGGLASAIRRDLRRRAEKRTETRAPMSAGCL
eukprot:1186093-Prorocentrum_minimum.AAC.4